MNLWQNGVAIKLLLSKTKLNDGNTTL